MKKINLINTLENISLISLCLGLLFFLNNNFLPKSLYLFGFSASIMLFLLIKNKSNVLKKDLLFLPIFLLFLLICLLFNYSFHSLKYIIYYFFGMIYLFYFLNNKQSIIKLLKFYYIGSIIFVFFTIFSYFFEDLYLKLIYHLYNGTSNYQTVLNLYKWEEYSGIAGQTGYNAFAISIGIIISFTHLIKEIKDNKKLNLKYLIILILQMFAIFLCSKRAILLFIVVTLLSMIFKFFSIKDKKNMKRIGLILLGVLIISSVCIILIEPLKHIFIKNAELFNKENLLNGRGPLYTAALELFKSNPIFGCGIKTFSALNADNLDVHNVYLQLLAENGIIGFLIFVPGLLSILYKTRKIIFDNNFKKNAYLYISYGIQFFFLLYSITGNTVYDVNMFYLYLISITIPFSIVEKNINKDNKIGIITFHRAENYGATLQSYALFEKIESYNKGVCMIDYRSRALEKPYSLLYLGQPNDSIPSKIYNLLKSIVLFPKNLLRKINFHYFRKNNLSMSMPIYNISEFDDYLDNLEYAITGSDQVWNPEITKEDADVYLLNVKTNCSKISYAASVGSDAKNIEFYEKIKNSISDYKCISVREENARNNLIEFNVKDVELCLDPVLLHDLSFWNKIRKDANIDRKYLFVYTITTNYDMIKYAEKIAKEKGLLIVHVDKKNRFNWESKSKYSCGPDVFVDLIANAEYVLTNSFHGLAFSIIYKKKFLVFPMKGRNSRIENLLKVTGLEKRMYSIDSENNIYKDVDFSTVKENLNKEILKSNSFIKKSLDIKD